VSERHVDFDEDAIGVGVVVHRLGTLVVAGSGGVRCGSIARVRAPGRRA
jgi:hypothetical protein